MATANHGPAVTVSSLDHLVLTVTSIPATIDFYTNIMGMKHTSFSPPQSPEAPRHALTFGAQKINLHQSGKEFEPKAGNVMPGSSDLCFLTEEPVDDVVKKLRDRRLEILEGGEVVKRTGARGQLRSVYVRDPDQNLIE